MYRTSMHIDAVQLDTLSYWYLIGTVICTKIVNLGCPIHLLPARYICRIRACLHATEQVWEQIHRCGCGVVNYSKNL